MQMKSLTKPKWAVAIQKRRDTMGVSQERLALEMDVSPSLITKIERGSHDFRKMTLKNFEALLGALEWTISDFERETDAKFETLTKSDKTRDDHAVPIGFYLVPVIGMAAGGIPDMYPVPTKLKRHATKIFQVFGDSMNGGNAPIKDGDHVLVDTTLRELQDGKIFVIEIIGNGHVVKRARLKRNQWWLESDNPEFETYAPDEARIIGRVYYRMAGDEL